MTPTYPAASPSVPRNEPQDEPQDFEISRELKDLLEVLYERTTHEAVEPNNLTRRAQYEAYHAVKKQIARELSEARKERDAARDEKAALYVKAQSVRERTDKLILDYERSLSDAREVIASIHGEGCICFSCEARARVSRATPSPNSDTP